MMISVTIRAEWFNEIKASVPHADPYFYTERGTDYVEVDVDEQLFEAVSKEMGWM